MRSLLLATALAIAALTVASPVAWAEASCKAPPGTSAIEEYCETVPAAGGDSAPGSGGPSLRRSVSGSTARSLERTSAGRALLKSPGGENRAAGGENGARGSGTAAAPAPSSSPIGAVGEAASSGWGLGSTFVWFLIALVVALAGAALLHRSRRGGA